MSAVALRLLADQAAGKALIAWGAALERMLRAPEGSPERAALEREARRLGSDAQELGRALATRFDE